MSGDLYYIDNWIYQTLSADAQIVNQVGSRIYVDMAPQNAPAGQMIIFAFLGGADRAQTLASTSRTTNAIYLIRAISQGSSYSLVKTTADRIDVLLSAPNQSVTIGDVLITGVRREQPHQRKDMENGVPYVYLGGFYRFLYQPTPV